MTSHFEAFCGGPLLNETLLLESHWPHFTDCFQNSLLIWVPCGWLWVTLPLVLVLLISDKHGTPLPSTMFNISKTFLSITLCLLSLLELLQIGSDDDTVYNVVYVAGALKAATFILSAVLIQLERLKGVTSSGVLWCFWFFFLIAEIIPFYSKIYQHEYDTKLFEFSLFYVSYACLLTQFLMSSFSEKRARNGYQLIGKNPTPESEASFPSKMTFWWLNSLVFTGFRRPLTEDDAYDLKPEDKSDRVIPEFTKAWNKEMLEAKLKRSYQEQMDKYQESYYNPSGGGTSSIRSSEKTPLMRAFSQPRGSLVGLGIDSKDGPERRELKVSLFKVIFKTYYWDIAKANFLNLIYVLEQFLSPLILQALMAYTGDMAYNKAHGYQWQGYVLAIGLFLVNMSLSFFMQISYKLAWALGMKVKSALVATVYKKSLTVSNEAKKSSTVGEVVNLMSVDCQRVQDFSMYLFSIWSVPLQMGISLYMIWEILGLATLSGVGFLLILMPFNGVIISYNRKFQRQQMYYKDARIKLMSEVLSGMKVLKLYAWEPSFQEKVEKIRRDELSVLRKASLLRAFMSFVWMCAPFLVTLVTFATYILMDDSNVLDASKAFVAITLLNILRAPINQLPMTVSFLVQLNVSLGRISKFLRSEDLDKTSVTYNSISESAVRIQNGTFTWDRTNAVPSLSNINVDIPEGKLVAVVGQVGSGKSSLISAMLGEMDKIRGQVTVKSSIAYVPQQAWIQNLSLRDNILFGKEYSKPVYDQIIDDCALKSDLEIFPGGDSTEIGEKGVNMSGGQKQRVSLARAVYNDADIYMLDDPLSAVDSHVAKHIFDNVVSDKGCLKGKTRILVTHGVQWLPEVDLIIVMTDGRVSEVGSYDELLSQNGGFAQFLKTYLTQVADSDDEEEEDPEVAALRAQMLERVEIATSDGDSSGDEKIKQSQLQKRRFTLSGQLTLPKAMKDKEEPPVVSGKKLVEDEKAETGTIKLSVFVAYFKALGIFFTLLIVFFIIAYQLAVVMSSIWLSEWTDDSLLKNISLATTSKYSDKNIMYLGIYGILGIAQGVLVLLYTYVMAIRMVTATGILHNTMLVNIMKNPMSFFDTTPSGRILNRFSRDVEVIDNQLPMMVRLFLNSFFSTLSTLVVISYTTPIFIVMVIPLAILYYVIQRFYIPTSRQLKRMESTTRSPIYTHFSETISGAACIRAYKASDRFIHDSQARVDKNLKYFYAGAVAGRWLGIRLQLIGSVLVLAAALFLVDTDDITESLVGLSISYALQITNSLNMLVRVTSDLETNIVSVERLREYSELPTEAPWINPHKRPMPSWPEEGYVRFLDYETRYRAGLDLVLKKINCTIKGGEKIGVVGRTGAGKSSLTLALFRLIESSGGSINIDDITISEIGLHDLRSKITILPQDPVLFSGTLRMNIDPVGEYTDDSIWEALEHAHLKDFTKTASGGLDYECGEEGKNLSVGQRQLLCLARSLLRKTKILVLDEATAAVDMETDDLIQKTIRDAFKECTVISIAHRLNTILDYDRVMVLDQGKIIEMDSPSALLDNKSSVFYGMAKDANLV